MGEQSVDLHSTVSVLRRKRRTLTGAVLVGAAAGVCSVVLWPPMYTSASLVLLPPAQDPSGRAVPRDVETEVRIATSDAVLRQARKSLSPSISVRELARRVEVTAATSDVLEIEGSADTPARAEAISQAVAQSEVDYAREAVDSVATAQRAALAAREKELQATLDTVNAEIAKARAGAQERAGGESRAAAAALAQLTAQQADLVLQIDDLKGETAGAVAESGASIIQDASPAERPLVERFLLFAMIGLTAAFLVTAALLVGFAKRDRRLRYRDEIADTLGTVVIASVRSRVPRTVAGWTSLFWDYAPGTVDAWAWRQAFRRLMFLDSPVEPHTAAQTTGDAHHPMSITVLSLSEDGRGLAMGPQLASYAASAGVRTRLVAGQRHETAATLWAACSRLDGDTEFHPHLVVDARPGDARQEDGAELTIVLAVVDRRKPDLRDLPATSVTVLAVAAGSATAEELARTAVTADDAGRRIAGIIVADPDVQDRTTGRLSQHERSLQTPLPSRLTGMAVSELGGTNVSRLRRRQG